VMYYDKEGLPITMQSWCILFETKSYRVIDQDTARDGSWVSTVWMGLNHSHTPGKILIFETMTFSKEDSSDVLNCRRYSTLKEAKNGHKEVLKDRNEAPRHHLRKLDV